MKRIIPLFCLVVLSYTSQSQVLISLLLGDKLNSGKLEFGLEGGLNLSDIQGLNDGRFATRFNLGFYFDFKLKNPSWMFHTGVIVISSMGATDLPVYDLGNPDLNTAFAGGSVDRNLAYFNVPFMMKYTFKNNFFIEGGPMFGLMNKSIDTFSKQIIDKDDLTYEQKIKENYHPIDVGPMLGIGYRLMGGNGMNVGVRYYYGLVDITLDDSSPNQYNRSLYFYIAIPVGKAPKKKE